MNKRGVLADHVGVGCSLGPVILTHLLKLFSYSVPATHGLSLSYFCTLHVLTLGPFTDASRMPPSQTLTKLPLYLSQGFTSTFLSLLVETVNFQLSHTIPLLSTVITR